MRDRVGFRKSDVLATDVLPDELRRAIRQSNYYIVAPVVRRGVDVKALAERVREVQSEVEVAELNNLLGQMR